MTVEKYSSFIEDNTKKLAPGVAIHKIETRKITEPKFFACS